MTILIAEVFESCYLYPRAKKMEKKRSAMDKGKNVAQLHWKVQQWKLRFQLMDDEMQFIKRLLDSNAFKSNIPNLFERLQDYKTRLEEVHSSSETTRTQIALHENNLGGNLDGKNGSISADLVNKNEHLQLEVDTCMGNYQNLKSEIFNYTGSILLMNKPDVK